MLGSIRMAGAYRKTMTKARELNEKAAAGGIGFSMDALGAMYINGWGVPKSDVMAREWYEKASAAGNTVGMQHLASMLDSGKGGSADPARAAHLLLQSAKLGHKWSVTVLDGALTFLTPATRIELKRESLASATIADRLTTCGTKLPAPLPRHTSTLLTEASQMKVWTLAATLLVAVSANTAVFAAKALTPKAQLEKAATHVVVGKVGSISSTTNQDAQWATTAYAAVIAISG